MGADLRNHGVGRGERVAALSGNRIELADLVLGCAWIGAVVVPLNTALRADSVASALEQAGVQRILVSPEYSGAVAGFDGTVWVMGEQCVPTAGSHPGCEPETLDPLDLAAILFTSGTTGLPRGVRCPHAQFLQWGKGVGASLGLTGDDVLYNCLPLFHTNALNAFVQSLWAGSTFFLGQRFSVRNHWREVREIGATVDYLLGAMVAMLMNADPSPQDRQHSVHVALAPATPAHLIEPFAQRFGVELVDGFGSTETNLVIGTLPGDRRAGYMGRVMSGYDAAVVNDGTAAADGEPGELVVDGFEIEPATLAAAAESADVGDTGTVGEQSVAHDRAVAAEFVHARVELEIGALAGGALDALGKLGDRVDRREVRALAAAKADGGDDGVHKAVEADEGGFGAEAGAELAAPRAFLRLRPDERDGRGQALNDRGEGRCRHWRSLTSESEAV